MSHRRIGAVLLLTLTSQVLSALNSLLLGLLGLASADTYAIASQIGLTGFTGVVVGIVYNLAVGRRHFRGWARWQLIAAITTVVAAAVQYGLLFATGYMERHDPAFVGAVFAAFALGGVFICLAATTAVRAALLGRPALFAGVTIFPNAGFACGTVAALLGAPLGAPALGWLLGSVAVWGWSLRGAVDQDVELTREQHDNSQLVPHTTGLVIGMATSTFMPLLFLAAVAQLPTGMVYLATLIAKFVNAGVAVGVNSVLIAKYNWDRSRALDLRLPRLLAASFVSLAASGIAIRAVSDQVVVASAIVVLSWAAAVMASAILVREVHAQRRGRMILAKSGIELLLTGVAALALFAHPSFIGYFGAFAISQAVTITSAGKALGDRALLVAGGLGLAVAFGLVLGGW